MNVHPSFSYNGISMLSEQWKTLLNDRVQSWEPWEQSHARFMLSWLDDSDTLEVQTSGSTGTPKTMLVSKAAMAASARMTALYFQCFENTRALLVLPSTFIAGKMMLVRAMTLGWQLTALEPVSHPLDIISEPFDFAAFTPMQLTQLSPAQLRLLGMFGSVIVGGAGIPDKVRHSLAACNGHLFETYGMAETLSHVAVRRIRLPEEPFIALPDVTFTADNNGRICIHAQHISDAPVQTQDIVELASETSFYYRGRFDRVINSGGIKLFAEVIERKLSAMIHVPFYISSQPDDTLGQRVVLYLEMDGDINHEEWIEKLRTVLDKYEIPKNIIVAKSFDRTHSGKIKFNS